MSFGRTVLAVVAGILLVFGGTSQAIADAVLYNDSSSTTWSAALTNVGITTSTVSDDSAFAMKLLDPTVNLAIVQFDASLTAHSSDLIGSLNLFIAGGGRVIFSSVSDSQYDEPVFGLQQTGFGDQGSLMTSMSIPTMALSSGVGNPVDVVARADLGVFYRSFSVLPMGVDPLAMGLATFADDNYAIILGHGGQTIVNGFAGGTVFGSSGTDAEEIQLYQNELGLLGIAAVPEPATSALLGLGLLVTAALGYRRRK